MSKRKCILTYSGMLKRAQNDTIKEGFQRYIVLTCSQRGWDNTKVLQVVYYDEDYLNVVAKVLDELTYIHKNHDIDSSSWFHRRSNPVKLIIAKMVIKHPGSRRTIPMLLPFWFVKVNCNEQLEEGAGKLCTSYANQWDLTLCLSIPKYMQTSLLQASLLGSSCGIGVAMDMDQVVEGICPAIPPGER